MFPRLGYGIGLRPPHFQAVLDGRGAVDWFEVITENFFGAGGNPLHVLRAVRERSPVVLHGVSLSIGAVDPLDERYLDALARLVAAIDPAMVSDHLCWSSFGGHTAHDLWTIPYTEAALDHVVERVARVQDRLGRRILLENPSSYVEFRANELAEPAFLAEVANRADCGIVLDVNNVYVSARNHGFDPDAYLAAIPADRVGYMHLAGHTDHGDYILDTHDHAVPDAVWQLYQSAVRRFGSASVLVEWDDQIPALDDVVAEANRARREAQAVRRG
ncbi:MAG: DUF692 domain-containing protein [Kofleriaceae bacterium]